MTTRITTVRQELEAVATFPDFPKRDDMQNWWHLYRTGIQMALDVRYADDPRVTVACEVPVRHRLTAQDAAEMERMAAEGERYRLPSGSSVRIPDLLVMIDCNLELLFEQNGYVIDGQGKAPDLALEVASKSTGVVDYTAKRDDYERYGVQEYWRYDPSGGEYHDAALAADRLVGGRYEPIAVEWLDADRCRGYSEVLELYVCWEYGELRFWDPASQDYIRTHQDDSERARKAEARADAAKRRVQAEARERRAAEARNAELEAELRRLRGE